MDFLAEYSDDDEVEENGQNPHSTASFLKLIRNDQQKTQTTDDNQGNLITNQQQEVSNSSSQQANNENVADDKDGENEEDYEQFENDDILTEYGDSDNDDNVHDSIDEHPSVFKSGATEDHSSTKGVKFETELLDIESYSVKYKIPISHQADLGGHDKAVVCFSFEPSGNRVVTGSLDYSIKAFDFGGMDSRHRAFRSLEPDNGHPITSIAHSSQGDRFVVATGSNLCIVYDRECMQIIKFAKGDMYIRDLVHTKGHTMEVTAIQWHPTDKNLILTSSLDGSLRIWDLLGEAHFGSITSKHVLKLRAVQGQGRLGATSCCYADNGNKIVGGAADGSIHIWQNKKTFSRPDWVVRPRHLSADSCCPVTSVVVSSDGKLLASRCPTDQSVLVWDFVKIVNCHNQSQAAAVKPMLEFPNLPNDYPTSNVDFSPDSTFLCCGTTPLTKAAKTQASNASESAPASTAPASTAPASTAPASTAPASTAPASTAPASTADLDTEAAEMNSFLCFYNVDTATKRYQLMNKQNTATEPLCIEPSLKITVSKGVSAIMVRWQPKTNQIFCSTSGGYIRAFFDPRFSVKGAVLTSGRAPKRVVNSADFLLLATDQPFVGEIINPNALPMYRNDTRITKKKDVKDLSRSKAPSKPDKTSTILSGQNRSNTSFFFTQYVMQNRGKDQSRSEDPREALLKLDSLARSDPMFLGKAYGETQPKTKLADLTFEQEQEEFKKKQKRVI